MKIHTEQSLIQFDAWSGAIDTKKQIIELGLAEEFEQLIDDCFPDGLSETQLNDILWFDSEWIYESLGIEITE